MDSADENEQEQEQNRYMLDEEGQQEPGNREDEAEEVPALDASKVIKPKRVVKNPRPKLDATRLMGPRGVGILLSSFKELKFKGKGNEKEDLNMLMKKLEHWAHRLFPKMTFDDTLTQIERLGQKKPVENMMKRIRLDMFQSDEMSSTQSPDEDIEKEEKEKEPEIDVFDELLGTGAFANNAPQVPDTSFDNLLNSTPSSQTKKIMTSEQRERMEKNKQLALERRKAKLEQEKQKTFKRLHSNSQESNSTFSSLLENSSELQSQNISKDSISKKRSSEESLDTEDENPIQSQNVKNSNEERTENSSDNEIDLEKKQSTSVPMEVDMLVDSELPPLCAEDVSEKEPELTKNTSNEHDKEDEQLEADKNLFNEDYTLSFVNEEEEASSSLKL